MSSPLNTVTPNMPFQANTFNDNAACAQLNVSAQQGSGVISGMTLSAGSGRTLNIAAGVVQNNRTVSYGGGTSTAPDNATNYVMADWVAVVNPATGISTYTFSFSYQGSSTPPGGQVCLGRVTAISGSITAVSTAGLVVLPHVTGSQFVVGENRLVIDDSTGMATVQNLQGVLAVKDHLVSGDAGIIDAGYQVSLFGSFKVDPGATFVCNGRLRVVT